MNNAIDMGLKGFHARNRTGEKEPEVIALVEGDEETITDFKKLIETQKSEHSQISSIAFEDYKDDVMKTDSYAQICSAIQLNKAIPLLLDIRNDMKEMMGDVEAVKKTTEANIENRASMGPRLFSREKLLLSFGLIGRTCRGAWKRDRVDPAAHLFRRSCTHADSYARTEEPSPKSKG